MPRRPKNVASPVSPGAPSQDAVPERVRLNVTLAMTPDTAVYYVNFAEVTCSPHEFSIAAAKTPTKLSAEKLAEARKIGSIMFDADIQLVVPPTVLPGLIRALIATKESYEKLAGAPIIDTGNLK